MSVKYDSIGIGYNRTRRADTYLLKRIYENLSPDSSGLYLDIGCGTGNYTHGLHQAGLRMVGIDPSETMLKIASVANNDISWLWGEAENTGLENASVHGAVATLTIHHWPNLERGFSEINRVLRKSGRIVIFTSTPEQMEGYWLNHYFPVMMKSSIDQMPTLSKVTSALESAGISWVSCEKYSVKPDLQDLFLYCGKDNPDLYFDPAIRQGISSFSSLANAVEVEAGLRQLKDDVISGKVKEVIESFENDLGDYLFIMGQKKD
ncbi:class I SAM-dependent methyltransferase [Fulvivirga sp. 29W222]|uniref:Class I SAM-dependent methyltransferase n=1 Tax=Fulvivirga marina TaxID=2494733 RepID=A0A937G0K5_9BACT|nr:class I SAM-dependent methyltransferase [Fulvivirga marina]MBL6447780.1 class I SAM-dependent methyltransferase [Fulvivirga marina]